MHNTGLTLSNFPMEAQAVALLPVPWRHLGSTMLGWIQQRGQLPAIMEKMHHRPLVHFRTSQVTHSPQHTTPDELDAMYQTWRNALNTQTRRQALGDLTQAFAPLIRATVRHCQISHAADRADLEQETPTQHRMGVRLRSRPMAGAAAAFGSSRPSGCSPFGTDTD